MTNATTTNVLDAPTAARKGEEIDAALLAAYLREYIPGLSGEIDAHGNFAEKSRIRKYAFAPGSD